MRVALLLLLLAAGGFRLVAPTVATSVGDPPIEIRIDGRGHPGLEDRISAIQEGFPALRRHRTTRFEILSDLDSEEVAGHRRLLERTAHAIEDFRTALGIDWTEDDGTPELVVAFASQADFIRFAIREDDMNARWLAGYFSPRHGHLAYHDARDHPDVRRAGAGVRPDVVGRGQADPSVDPRTEGLRRFISRTNAVVVVHEATHMLLHRRRILEATTETPLWIAEGLAGSFEPVEPERRFGPTRPYNARTEEFRRLLADDAVPGIRWLLAQDEMPDPTTQHSFYATSAVLCSWLVRHRPDGMRQYLELLRPTSAGDTRVDEPGRRWVDFETAFGDIDGVEADWLAWERAVADTVISVVDDAD